MFAPRLRFDRNAEDRCWPSNPGEYYEARKAGNKDIICSTDYQALGNGKVEAYYWHNRCAEDLTVITYWFYYGYQKPCLTSSQTLGLHGDEGYHHVDWEKVYVLLDKGELKRVGYSQHTGQYSRDLGNFGLIGGTHPIAYVGKDSHGSYHDDGGTGNCLYFEDWRNPGTPDYHWDTWNNLVDLAPGLLPNSTAPEWMRTTANGSLFEDNLPPNMRGLNMCAEPACVGKDEFIRGVCLGKACGCWKSDQCGINFANMTRAGSCSQGGVLGVVNSVLGKISSLGIVSAAASAFHLSIVCSVFFLYPSLT